MPERICSPLDNIETYFYAPLVQCTALQKQGAIANPAKDYKCCVSDLCNGVGSITKIELEVSGAVDMRRSVIVLVVSIVAIALAF